MTDSETASYERPMQVPGGGHVAETLLPLPFLATATGGLDSWLTVEGNEVSRFSGLATLAHGAVGREGLGGGGTWSKMKQVHGSCLGPATPGCLRGGSLLEKVHCSAWGIRSRARPLWADPVGRVLPRKGCGGRRVLTKLGC